MLEGVGVLGLCSDDVPGVGVWDRLGDAVMLLTGVWLRDDGREYEGLFPRRLNESLLDRLWSLDGVDDLDLGLFGFLFLSL